MAELRVHHLEFSRSSRVLWLLHELDVDYEMVRHARDKFMRAPAALRQLHPLGKAPIIEHEGKVLAESGAILEYLVERFGQGRLVPTPGTQAYLDYRYWMHYAEGSLMSPLLLRLVLDKVKHAPMPFFIKPVARGIVDKVDSNFLRRELEQHAAFLEETLSGREWFAGDAFSVADIQMIYGVQALLTRGASAQACPKLSAWRDACFARPACARALELGGGLIPR